MKHLLISKEELWGLTKKFLEDNPQVEEDMKKAITDYKVGMVALSSEPTTPTFPRLLVDAIDPKENI